VRGEGGAGERAQVLLDQVAQRAGPGRGSVPAAGGGLDDPPSLGGQVTGGVQGGEGGVQVPGREGLAGFAGGLREGRDVPGRIGGDRRVRLGGGFGLLALGGAVGRDRGGLAGVGRLGGGLSGAGGAARAGVSAGGASPPGAAGAAAGVQVSAMPGLLPLMRVAVPFFSCASSTCRAAAALIPARAAMTATAATAAPPGSADSAARTAAAGLWAAAGAKTGAGAGSVAALAALRAACGAGAGFLVRAMVVTPFLIARRDSRFYLPAPVFSGRQLLWAPT
jgi:hypothetical protein